MATATAKKARKATKTTPTQKFTKHCGQFVEWQLDLSLTPQDGKPLDDQTAQAVAEMVMAEHVTLMNINWRDGESGEVAHEGRKYRYELKAERGDDHAVEDFTDWEPDRG